MMSGLLDAPPKVPDAVIGIIQVTSRFFTVAVLMVESVVARVLS
jgi:hypothetical protein